MGTGASIPVNLKGGSLQDLPVKSSHSVLGVVGPMLQLVREAVIAWMVILTGGNTQEIWPHLCCLPRTWTQGFCATQGGDRPLYVSTQPGRRKKLHAQVRRMMLVLKPGAHLQMHLIWHNHHLMVMSIQVLDLTLGARVMCIALLQQLHQAGEHLPVNHALDGVTTPRNPLLVMVVGATLHKVATVVACKKVGSPGALKTSLLHGMTPTPRVNLRVGVKAPSHPMVGAPTQEGTVVLVMSGVTLEKERRMDHPALPGREMEQDGKKALVVGENHPQVEAGEMHNAPMPQHRDGVTSLRRVAMAVMLVEAWVHGEVQALSNRAVLVGEEAMGEE